VCPMSDRILQQLPRKGSTGPPGRSGAGGTLTQGCVRRGGLHPGLFSPPPSGRHGGDAIAGYPPGGTAVTPSRAFLRKTRRRRYCRVSFGRDGGDAIAGYPPRDNPPGGNTPGWATLPEGGREDSPG
jgi:hypothetical protein